MSKEAMKKNLFWYLFGGFGLVFLILLICAMVSGSAEAGKKKDDLTKLKKAVTDAKSPKNDKFIAPWNDARKFYADIKDKVWETAWNGQKDFYVWPDAKKQVNAQGQVIDFNQLMLYGSDTLNLETRVREAYQRVYRFQFADDDAAPKFTLKDLPAPAIFGPQDTDFATIMAPTMAASGGGAGQPGNTPPGRGFPGARGGDYMASPGSSAGGVTYLTVIDSHQHTEITAPPTPEEIWILQEDFWVKREMLNILRTVQRNAGRFKRLEVKPDAPRPEGVQPNAVAHRFANGYWEITLYVETANGLSVLSPKSTLKNISPDHAVQVVAEARGTKPLEFNLTQKEASVTFPVSGVPLEYNKSQPMPDLAKLRVDNLNLSQDFGLEQKFDWSNAPVRRVDALLTAKQSHRTAIHALEPNPIFKSKDDATATGTTATPTPTGPGAPAGPMNSPGPGGPGGFAAATNSDPTTYGLERNRYIFPTEYARHLPIAMDLVVEPAYIDDVLVAIANSPLRIQTTQIAFQKLASVPPPPDPETAAKDGTQPKTPGYEKPARMPPTKFGPNGMPITGVGADDNGDTNLVELTVYGIATLYERFKPRDTASPAPGGPQGNPMPTPPGTAPKPMPMPGKP